MYSSYVLVFHHLLKQFNSYYQAEDATRVGNYGKYEPLTGQPGIPFSVTSQFVC